MSVLEDLTSRDPHRIWEGACAIRELRDMAELTFLAGHLEQIKQSTSGIDLGGALRPNSTHLEFALRKLEYVRNNGGCLCNLYPLDEMFDPSREARAGSIVIHGQTINKEEWSSVYDCECCACHARYSVVEQAGYHYPWWAWRRV